MLRKLNVLKSLFLLSLVGVIGFMATQALFIDRETSQDSSFVVGTLDMNVTGPGSQQAESLQVTSLGAQNIVSGGKSWTINNVGTLPGRFYLELTNIKNLDNGCNEPEALEDSSCGTPGEGQGELGAQIATTIKITEDNTERTIFTSNLSDAAVSQYQTFWRNNAGEVIIPPGKSLVITLDWSTENSSFTNAIQSDSVTFDVLFNLRQVVPNSANNPQN